MPTVGDRRDRLAASRSAVAVAKPRGTAAVPPRPVSRRAAPAAGRPVHRYLTKVHDRGPARHLRPIGGRPDPPPAWLLTEVWTLVSWPVPGESGMDSAITADTRAGADLQNQLTKLKI